MPNKPATMGDALAQARTSVAKARLADPDEHFPYRIQDVLDLIDDDTPMGPSGPDDETVTATDFTSRRIAQASESYIDAQKAFLEDPSRGNRERYEAAKEDLLASRKAHRRARVDADGNPVSAVVANTPAMLPEHLRGPRLRRVGEE